MQGRPVDDVELWDAQVIAGHLVEAGSVFALLAEHRRELFPESMFSDLFRSGTGRPSIATDVMAAVMVLQALEGLTDRETAQAVRTDIRWKVACGLPIADAGFHDSTLTYWRRRLAASERPHRIFDAVSEVIAQTGVLKGRKRRALDSTVFHDAVATQDTVTQLISQIRAVARLVPGAADVVAEQCTAHDYSQAGKPRIAWNDPVAREELLSALVEDALRLLAVFDPDDLTDAQGQALALLALVAGQDVEPAEGSDGTDGRWRIARKVAHDRVISTVDPEARHARKTRENRQDGFKGHVIVEPETGLTTGCEMTAAVGSDNADAATGIRLLGKDKTIGRQQAEVLGDSAYGTGEMLAELAGRRHTPVIKPWPLTPAVPGGFSTDEFIVDEAAGTLTCPLDTPRQSTPAAP